jgi:hypothetical protein
MEKLPHMAKTQQLVILRVDRHIAKSIPEVRFRNKGTPAQALDDGHTTV